MKTYYVYIAASASKVLYVGMTNNLDRRMREHKESLIPGFTSRYRVRRLMHYEVTHDVKQAILREKQIKAWRRNKKVELIESMNPKWIDLSGTGLPC
jgi:putative endonuclease